MIKEPEVKMLLKAKMALCALFILIILAACFGFKLNSKLIFNGLIIFLGLNMCLFTILAHLLELDHHKIIKSHWLKKILYQARVFLSGKEYADYIQQGLYLNNHSPA